MEHVSGLEVLNVAVSLFSGFLGALFLFLIKEHLFKPVLRIEFANDVEYVFTTAALEDVTKKPVQAQFLRFKICNKGKLGLKVTARNVRAYLKKLVVTDLEGNNFETNEMWLPLRASDTLGSIKVFDLPTGIPQYIDVCCCRSDADDKLSPRVEFPIRAHDLFKKSGTYQAQMVVVADNASATEKTIKFKWRTGQFNSLEAA